MVPDVDKACERFEKLGVNFIKRPQDGKMKTIAFITDPDGYWIEIFNNKNVWYVFAIIWDTYMRVFTSQQIAYYVAILYKINFIEVLIRS